MILVLAMPMDRGAPAVDANRCQGSLTFLVLSGYPDRVEIRDSARKRGHQDSDMLHAVRHALAIFTVPGQDVTMYLGPAHSGTLLEVGVAGADGDNPRIIHCMNLRKAFMPMLPQGDVR